MRFYDAKEVRLAAAGNWLAIIASLAPHLEGAVRKPGRHSPCPVHGGNDGFRLFKDVNQTGGGICNSCGPKSDGISLLMWACDLEYRQVLQEVAGLLGVEPKQYQPNQANRQAAPAAPAVPAVPASKPVATFEGVIVRWGAAPYQHNAANSKSFFLELELKDGKTQTLWGWGLRGFTSIMAKGQEVLVKNLGKPQGSRANRWDVVVAGEQAQASAPAAPAAPAAGSQVISLHRDKPWLKEVAAKMQERLEKERIYAIQLKERIASIWAQCVPVTHHAAVPVRKYLNSRGMVGRGVSQDALRFHPALPYHDSDGNHLGNFPAMVGAIRDNEGNLVTLHRTYLTVGGEKARLPKGNSEKKMMPIPHGMDVKGCSIALHGGAGVIGVAEGIETSLACYRATGIPCFAAISAVLMECFEPPAGVHTVVIWADKDRSGTGQASAEALAHKLRQRGLAVHIMLPMFAIPATSKSIDWNDVLVIEGVTGFPDYALIRSIKRSNQDD